MMRRKRTRSLTAALVVLFCGAWMTFPCGAAGQQKIPESEGMSYQVNASMAENLKTLVGKKVYVTLDSGKTFVGTVKEVGNHLVHLEKLEGKEYFDALIRVESIGAIDARFRGPQK